MGFEETWAYDALEFIAFIIPRLLQLVLSPMTQFSLLNDTLANNLYHGFSYLSAAALVVWSLWRAKETVYDGAVIINRQTSVMLASSIVFIMIAGFTAAAPTTGLSLKYCAKAAAGFVRFSQ